MPIKVLPQEVISKIAAGEVIERPASVVKELIENSLDAGATQIWIEAQGSGLKFIKVIDNGSGIPATNVETAFQRYATSKISKLDDLSKISTLGFRGEALPSIAAVAQVEMLTKAEDDDTGTLILVENGLMTRKGKQSRPRGTSVTVRYLFRNFPARLKFLKSTTTENGHIADVVSHYAMAFPEVKFHFVLEGRRVLSTNGTGNLRDVVAAIYGLDLAKQMIEIRESDEPLLIFGMISPPSIARSNRSYLDFFVNRRWIRNNVLARAVEEAYHGWLLLGKYPIAILNLNLPAQEIDVNVHPAKTEIRFRNNQLVFVAVQKSVRKGLETIISVPKIKTADMQFSPTPSLLPVSQCGILNTAVFRVIGQLSNTYIMAEGADGLFLIDQHAAHERVLFEKILGQNAQQKVEVQGLLEPVYIELDPKRDEILKIHSQTLEQFGIKLEPFGTRYYLLRAVPALMKKANLVEAVHNLLDSLSGETELKRSKDRIAISVACHSAVKAGEALSMEEMKELITQLEQTTQPQTCPHGRPTMLHFSSRQLEREFGRLR